MFIKTLEDNKKNLPPSRKPQSFKRLSVFLCLQGLSAVLYLTPEVCIHSIKERVNNPTTLASGQFILGGIYELCHCKRKQ